MQIQSQFWRELAVWTTRPRVDKAACLKPMAGLTMPIGGTIAKKERLTLKIRLKIWSLNDFRVKAASENAY